MKGILLYHSVGTGKTCTAIAAATRNFEPADYTILWVTRTTLKNNIGKICSIKYVMKRFAIKLLMRHK
jgi:hypothetical protein